MNKKKIIRYSCGMILLLIMGMPFAYGQQTVSLGEAIRIAQGNSFESKVAQNRWQSSTWRFRNFNANFLPTLFLDGDIPNYTRAISRITVPSGEDVFVGQNQSYSSLRLGLRQNLGLTGGTISINSSLNRIDVFGSNRAVDYSSTPFSISYNQQTLGYNAFKWQKMIEPQVYEASQRKLTTDLENIASQTVNYYFNTLSAQARLILSRQNVANIDTLYRIAQDRFHLGNIAQTDMLQLRLNKLNAQKQVTQDSMDYVLSRQQFSRYLLLSEDWDVVFDDHIDFFEIRFDEALEHAYNNSHQVIQSRVNRLEAEQHVAETKAQTGLKFNIHANFGVTNSAQQVNMLLRGMENQQQVYIGFSVPLLDWGYAKTRKQQAESNLAMVENEIEQQNLQIEQEIALYISRWNLHRQQVEIAKETQNLAIQNYELEMDRFTRGTISINDLNIAQNQKDQASNAYIETIRGYWDLYYTIRKLTLYDFRDKNKL